MILPDIIVTQPRHIDFPIFRYNIKRFRKYFGKVLISFAGNAVQGRDYSEFFVNNMDDVQFVKSPLTGQDWRDNAVKDALNFVTSSKILFLEQDFLIKDDRFFEVLLTQFEYPFVYYEEGGRRHPACALVPTDVVMKTGKDFSARPPVYDHFGLFFREVEEIIHGVDLETIGLHSREDYYHLASCTQNYASFLDGDPLYKPNEFLTYNFLSINVPVPQLHDFYQLMGKINREYSVEGSEFDETVASFFPKKGAE